ncbi:MAG: pyridoxal phosphate-dependent aminotransferase family protein [Planctomycetes bacterium]|nr:pyridoxal phosphate-dependent aminotransferase family protein [Planctomycetota bacterium]
MSAKATQRRAYSSGTATSVHVGNRDLVLFGGCDYLGLAHHPRVIQALQEGLHCFGVSASGSRATTGNATAHDELEAELARFFDVEAALLVPDGYLSNIVMAQSLPEDIEIVLLDRESHVSIRDAVRISGCSAREYAHVAVRSARQCAQDLTGGPFAIFTDGVFPVLRAVAPLAELLQLLPQTGLLVVDDCHGVGVLGARGRGSVEHAGIADPRIVITGTLSKALGCFGGFLAGSARVVERARVQARAFIASTPIPPALARAASAALRVIDDEPERLARAREHTSRLRVLFARLGLPVSVTPLPVLALQLPSHARMQHVHETLLARGLLVPFVEYPDGLGGYLRIALRADHEDAHVDALIEGLMEALK